MIYKPPPPVSLGLRFYHGSSIPDEDNWLSFDSDGQQITFALYRRSEEDVLEGKGIVTSIAKYGAAQTKLHLEYTEGTFKESGVATPLPKDSYAEFTVNTLYKGKFYDLLIADKGELWSGQSMPPVELNRKKLPFQFESRDFSRTFGFTKDLKHFIVITRDYCSNDDGASSSDIDYYVGKVDPLTIITTGDATVVRLLSITGCAGGYSAGFNPYPKRTCDDPKSFELRVPKVNGNVHDIELAKHSVDKSLKRV